MAKLNLYTSLVYEAQFDALEALCETLETQAILGHIVGLCVSPTHTPDKEDPHPHKHIIIASTKKALSKNDREAMYQLGLMPNNVYIQTVIDQEAMERYLCHRGAKWANKEQFPLDVVPDCFGRYKLASDAPTSQRITDLIDLYDIYEIYDLMHLPEVIDDQDLYDKIVDKAYFVQSLLVSKRKRFQAVHDVVNETLAGIL